MNENSATTKDRLHDNENSAEARFERARDLLNAARSMGLSMTTQDRLHLVAEKALCELAAALEDRQAARQRAGEVVWYVVENKPAPQPDVFEGKVCRGESSQPWMYLPPAFAGKRVRVEVISGSQERSQKGTGTP